MSSLQRYLDNVVAEDSWGHPNWNEWAATLFDELVSCVESLEERVETLTEAHDAAQPEPAQTYGDKRGTYAEQPTETSDGWLAECAENWWVHQRGSTDTNRSRWALQYADRLIAAAKENAAFQEAIDDYHADAVEWRGKYNTERERNSRLERSNASNLKACDELKAKLEQTTASLIAECDETTKLRADLAAAKVKIADTTRDLDWYMKAYNRERDEVNSLNCANASNLLAEQPDGWLAECEAKLASYMADDELRKWVVKYSKRLIAVAKRTQCVERALPANAQAEKDLRKAEDILANVVDCIRGRITHRDPRDKREQLLWFASELKRAAEEIGALLEERW